MMLDFMLTYAGIHCFDFIVEGNPLHVWLFELPFFKAFFIRLSYVSFIVYLFKFIYKSKYKHYDIIIWFALIVNFLVLCIHCRWLIIYYLVQ